MYLLSLIWCNINNIGKENMKIDYDRLSRANKKLYSGYFYSNKLVGIICVEFIWLCGCR